MVFKHLLKPVTVCAVPLSFLDIANRNNTACFELTVKHLRTILSTRFINFFWYCVLTTLLLAP